MHDELIMEMGIPGRQSGNGEDANEVLNAN